MIISQERKNTDFRVNFPWALLPDELQVTRSDDFGMETDMDDLES